MHNIVNGLLIFNDLFCVLSCCCCHICLRKKLYLVTLRQELKAAKACEMPRLGSGSGGGSSGWPPLDLPATDAVVPPISVIKQEANLCGRDLWADCSLDGQGNAGGQKGSVGPPQQPSSFGMRMPLLTSISHHESSAPRSAFMTPVGMSQILSPYPPSSGRGDPGRLTNLTPLSSGGSPELRAPTGRGIEPRGCVTQGSGADEQHMKATNLSASGAGMCQTNLAETGHSVRSHSPRSHPQGSEERRVLVPAGKTSIYMSRNFDRGVERTKLFRIIIKSV